MLDGCTPWPAAVAPLPVGKILKRELRDRITAALAREASRRKPA